MCILGERGVHYKLQVRVSFILRPVPWTNLQFPLIIVAIASSSRFLILALESYSTSSIPGSQPNSSISLSHFPHPWNQPPKMRGSYTPRERPTRHLGQSGALQPAEDRWRSLERDKMVCCLLGMLLCRHSPATCQCRMAGATHLPPLEDSFGQVWRGADCCWHMTPNTGIGMTASYHSAATSRRPQDLLWMSQRVASNLSHSTSWYSASNHASHPVCHCRERKQNRGKEKGNTSETLARKKLLHSMSRSRVPQSIFFSHRRTLQCSLHNFTCPRAFDFLCRVSSSPSSQSPNLAHCRTLRNSLLIITCHPRRWAITYHNLFNLRFSPIVALFSTPNSTFPIPNVILSTNFAHYCILEHPTSIF